MTIILNPELLKIEQYFLIHCFIPLPPFLLSSTLTTYGIAVFKMLPVRPPCCTTPGSTVVCRPPGKFQGCGWPWHLVYYLT